MNVDVLAIGAHPDDVETGVGALLHKFAARGLRTAVLDLTEGEMASRGSVAERRAEAQKAAEILGVAERKNAGLPDSGIENAEEQRLALAPFIRAWRPRLILAPMTDDRHPDHEAAHALVRDANYMAGLSRVAGPDAPYRAPRIYGYRVYLDPTPPQMLIDVTGHFDAQMEALRAYASQFHNPEYDGPETYVASRAFWDSIQTRAAYWGTRVGVRHAVPLYSPAPLTFDMPPGIEEAP